MQKQLLSIRMETSLYWWNFIRKNTENSINEIALGSFTVNASTNLALIENGGS